MSSNLSPRREGNSLPDTSTRGALVAAARELFEENGYASTTVEHIRARADVSRASFYFYFPDKRAVFFEVIKEYGSDLRRLQDLMADDADDPFTHIVIDHTVFYEMWARYTTTFRDAHALSIVDDQAKALLLRFRRDHRVWNEVSTVKVSADKAWTDETHPLLPQLLKGMATGFAVGFFAQHDSHDRTNTSFEDAVLTVSEAWYRLVYGEPAPRPFPMDRIEQVRRRIEVTLGPRTDLPAATTAADCLDPGVDSDGSEQQLRTSRFIAP